MFLYRPVHSFLHFSRPATRNIKLQKTPRSGDIIYRGFVTILGVWFNFLWWAMCAGIAAGALLLYIVSGSIVASIMVVTGLAFIISLAGLLSPGLLRAARAIFLSTLCRVAVSLALEIAGAYFIGWL